MSDKQLQRVTEGVADIGQAAVRRAVLNPRKFFHRVKGGACTSELIGLYDVIARLISIALLHDVPLGKLSDLLAEAKYVASRQSLATHS